MVSPILELTDDDLLYLLQNLDISTLLNIRQTCKRLYLISLAKQVWVNVRLQEIVMRNLPWPSYFKPIDEFTSEELERLVLHTLKLDRRMTLPRPPTIIPFHQTRSVTWLRLIHAEWLLVASSDSVSSSISLWKISSLLASADTAKHIPATESFLPAPVINGVVDVDANTLTFALELCGSTPRIDILTVLDLHGSPRICRVQSFDNMAELRFMRGGLIGVSVFNNTNLPSVLRCKEVIIEFLCLGGPNLQGGAVAMYLHGDWLAVVRRWAVEIYAISPDLPDNRWFYLWGSAGLSHGIGSAEFVLAVPPEGSAQRDSSLRLCITCSDGIFVYDVVCDFLTQTLSLNLLWCHSMPDEEDVSQGSLGVTGDRVSWLLGGIWDMADPLKFATAKLPRISNEMTSTLVWHDEKMPAQYCLGVRDYDEARGVAIFGNGFGELCLYDFSGSNQSLFNSCTQEMIFFEYNDEEILPTEECMSIPYPPFPYTGSVVGTEVEESVFEFWRSHRPDSAPREWSADFENNEWFLYFSGQARLYSWYAWGIANGAHFYGRPIPLLHGTCGVYDVAVFDIGGLLFVWWKDEEEVHVYNPESGATLGRIVDSFDFNHQGLYPRTIIRIDDTQMLRGWRFHSTFMRELLKEGRNRWKELYDRGGRVHIELLDKDNLPKEARVPID